MNQFNSLLSCADEHGIDIDWFPMKQAESLSVPLGNDRYGVAIDPTKIRSCADLKHKLAHELGHCMTGAFYNRYSDFDCRQKYENRADRWAINNLVPAEDFRAAIAKGLVEIWDLAEHFDTTEDLIKKAMCFYTYGNLAVDLYF